MYSRMGGNVQGELRFTRGNHDKGRLGNQRGRGSGGKKRHGPSRASFKAVDSLRQSRRASPSAVHPR